MANILKIVAMIFGNCHKTSWEVGNSVPLGTRGMVRHGSPAAAQGILIPVNPKMRNRSHLCGE